MTWDWFIALASHSVMNGFSPSIRCRGRSLRSDAMCRAFAAAYEVNGPQLTEPKARTITNGMCQKVKLRLAVLAPSA